MASLKASIWENRALELAICAFVVLVFAFFPAILAWSEAAGAIGHWCASVLFASAGLMIVPYWWRERGHAAIFALTATFLLFALGQAWLGLGL